ncbi:MAG: DUF423 domain-containing protein [Sandaracinaceae bacterium]
MDRAFLILTGVVGALAVALGAFGAHGLRFEEGGRRLWETAAHYHLTHALALGLAAWLMSRGDGLASRVAGFAFLLGTLVFSGTVYALALGAPRWLGAITPIGGLSLILGWVALAIAGWRP